MITTVGTPAAPRLSATNVLVAIDDTDNLESPGTGRLSRMLLDLLVERGLGTALGATRHQLFVDPRIPYTSHNSSVCIALDAGAQPDLAAITALAAAFLEQTSAEGSDPGLAVSAAATWLAPKARERLAAFGRLAKRDVLNKAAARALAGALGVRLSEHGGDGGGIIGALAGVGLHLSGDDGRFLWMPGMRDVSGAITYRELLAAVPIDAALGPDGSEPAAEDMIELGEWVRPVLRGGRAVLLLDATSDAPGPAWSTSSKDVVKTH
jgi:hypothetical protein